MGQLFQPRFEVAFNQLLNIMFIKSTFPCFISRDCYCLSFQNRVPKYQVPIVRGFPFLPLTKRTSSHQRCFIKTGFLNFVKFIWKHLHQGLFFNTVAGLRPAILLKKRLWDKCFLENFAKSLRTPFWQNIFWQLLL